MPAVGPSDVNSNAHHRRPTFVIYVGTVELTFHESPVRASRILDEAGFRPPDEYVLEALAGPNGPAVKEYRAEDDVPLGDDHPRYFRAVPKGGGRA